MFVASATGIIILCSVLVPFLHLLGLNSTAQLLNWPLSIICHQLPSRCIELFGLRLAICSRCFAFFLAMLICSLWYLYSGIPKLPINIKILMILITPLIVDGTTQFFGLRVSTNTLRIITGLLAGIGAAFSILPFLAGKQHQSIFKFQHGGMNV